MAFLLSLVIIVPLNLILLLAWWGTRLIIFVKLFLCFWIGILFLMTCISLIKLITDKVKLSKKDYYGEYIINREYFSGKQSNWQYNRYCFLIKENDSIYFYVTDKERVLKTYKGIIKTTDPEMYRSDRLIIEMENPSHHILSDDPTTYRDSWSFYLVFHSKYFNNVYFKEGKWVPLK